MGSRGPPDISGTFSLLVLNISFRTTPQELRAEFERFGTLADVYIPRGNRGTSRGYAFVRYFEKEDAEAARLEMDKKTLDNREIAVQIAQREKDRRPRSPRNFRSRSPPFRGGYGRGRGGGGGGGGPSWRDQPPRRFDPRGFDDGPRRDGRRNFDNSPSSSRRFESRNYDDAGGPRRDSRRPRDISPTPGLSPERKRARPDFPEDPRGFRRNSENERNRNFDRQSDRDERDRFRDGRRNRAFRDGDERADRFSRDVRDNRSRRDERDERGGRRDEDDRVKERGSRGASTERDDRERFIGERNDRVDGGGGGRGDRVKDELTASGERDNRSKDGRNDRFDAGEREDRFKNRERGERSDQKEEPSQLVSHPVSTTQTVHRTDGEEDAYRRRE